MPRAQHGLTLDTTADGWDYSSCECGWMSPPCPGREEAWGFFNDHIQSEFAKVEKAQRGGPGSEQWEQECAEFGCHEEGTE